MLARQVSFNSLSRRVDIELIIGMGKQAGGASGELRSKCT